MLRTFDPMKVNVTFNNRQLRMFGDSLFTLARDEANVTLKKGAKGDSTYVLNASRETDDHAPAGIPGCGVH